MCFGRDFHKSFRVCVAEIAKLCALVGVFIGRFEYDLSKAKIFAMFWQGFRDFPTSVRECVAEIIIYPNKVMCFGRDFPKFFSNMHGRNCNSSQLSYLLWQGFRDFPKSVLVCMVEIRISLSRFENARQKFHNIAIRLGRNQISADRFLRSPVVTSGAIQTILFSGHKKN